MAHLQEPAVPLAFAGGHLRPWHVDDAPDLVAAWQDEAIARFNAVPAAPSPQLARSWIDGVSSRLDQGRSLDLAIELDGAPGVVGEVGLSGFSGDRRGALIGYWVLDQARGRGIATHAVTAFAAWAFATLELEVIVARCDPENLPSQRVAERCQFAHESHDPQGKQLWRKRPQ